MRFFGADLKKSIVILISILSLFACKTKTAVIKKDGKFGLIDMQGNVIGEIKWDNIPDHMFLPHPVLKNGLYGFVDNNGKVIIEPRYSLVSFFSDGLTAVKGDNGKYGFINIKGDTLIDYRYDNVFGGFYDGLCSVMVNDSCGYIDKNGDAKIPFRYKYCDLFYKGYASAVTFDNENIVLDKMGVEYSVNDERLKGKYICPEQLNSKTEIKTKQGNGRLNSKGDTIIPPIYDFIPFERDGMHIVRSKSGKWGAYNNKGDLVVDFRFDKLWYFSKGLAPACINNSWGYINRKGEVVIDLKFEYASMFSEGLAYVVIGGKGGFINKKGKLVIPAIYDDYRFSEFKSYKENTGE
ncbi:MAG: WG repeat-containing protein [Bacteroidales bacterium]|jgi:hypothetical protein|nr:WG repeat-containing protein [Bacteroidales bacterium]